MKTLFLLCCCLASYMSFAQTTPIPDPVFETVLINLGIDTNGMTGDILNSDAEGVLNLNVDNSGISSLSGIQAFVDLQILDCDSNMLSLLDVSSNEDLVNLDCQDNLLTSLTLGSNSNLTSIICANNQLNSVNLASLPALSDFSCQDNQLTTIDLSNNPSLYQLVAHGNNLTDITLHPSPSLLQIFWVYDNQLTNIDLTTAPSLATLRFEDNALVELDLRNGNNTNINTMDARNNAALELICVDDINYASNAPNWNKDATAEYSETCLLSADSFSLEEISLVPNPVETTFQIIGLEASQVESLELIDTFGRIIELHSTEDLDLSAFNSGVYFLRIRTVDGMLYLEKLIKE